MRIIDCRFTTSVLLPLTAAFLISQVAFAGQNEPSKTNPLTLREITVIGSKEEVNLLPGSGAYIDSDAIRKHSSDDINEVLRSVPGVYLREEDGFGLFPNISLRGVDPARSGKVTLMEDGIITAPAPYSAPSAYYSPTTGRMHAIEVLKGSSQIKYGPHTTGGVVNYISTPVPKGYAGYIKTLYGTDNEVRIHSYIGDTLKGEFGRFGYLVEGYYRENDGFKRIDKTPDFSDTERTGFRNSEPMLKLSWEPDTPNFQRLEWKIGYTDRVADETYLGLSTADFRANPFRRYSASRFDNIDTKQTRTYLQYMIGPFENVLITTTGYFNKFSRDWFKLHQLRSPTVSLSAALEDPASLAILKGEAAGTLRVRHNRRKYEAYGIQSVLDWNFEWGEIPHELESGVRFHNDYVRRRQWNVDYTQDANGVITAESVGPDGGAGNRRQETDAWAFFLKDTITVGPLTLEPGVRYEVLDYEYKDFGSGADAQTVTATGSQELEVWAPGIGAIYKVNNKWSLFGGVHKGFSVPGPRANVRSGIEEETSLGYELGTRFDNQNYLRSEVVFFLTDFNDLIVTDNIGGSGSGITENVGNITSSGLEWLLEYDPGSAKRWGFKNPWRLAFTYTNAELDGDSNSTDAESLFSGGQNGNKVPYIPEFQLAFSTGIELKKWSLFVDMTFVDETFTTANNVDDQIKPDGTRDARFGKTDDYFTVDVSGQYQLSENAKAVVNFQNIFDKEYLVSRHPHGPRPGRPFTILAGIEIKF